MADPVDDSLEDFEVGWSTPYPSAPPQFMPGAPQLFPDGGGDGVPYPTIPGGGGPSGLYPDIGFRPDLVSATKTYMECPICFEILTAPIYQCQNGHIICNNCINRIQFCGECRIPLGDSRIRNVALEYISQSMEVPCPNSTDGCLVLAIAGNLKNHMEVCDFRPIPLCSKHLGWTECIEKVTASSAINHLREVHQVEEVEQAKFSLRLIAPPAASQFFPGVTQEVYWSPLVITSALDDADAVLKCAISRTGYISFTCYLLGNTEDCKKYRVKLEFDSSAKVARIEWTGSPLAYRHQPEEIPNINTFRLHLETLKEFCKPHSLEDDVVEYSMLKVKVSVWKISDDDSPFKECFRNADGEKEPLEKVFLTSKSPESRNFSETMHYSDPEHYYSDFTCQHCSASLFGIIYRCLQCPSAYFCKNCTERNVHGIHLLLRISRPEQQPLSEVVYECAAGELA
ncbi:unnamed protein product [Orchesella dallaii]|uniref:RING-type E3 ubiquitin transferase n=1 Tax=Orchesella dallaii TaxID=48710 RepID=A0ABP1RR14_9HEXA